MIFCTSKFFLPIPQYHFNIKPRTSKDCSYRVKYSVRMAYIWRNRYGGVLSVEKKETTAHNGYCEYGIMEEAKGAEKYVFRFGQEV